MADGKNWFRILSPCMLASAFLVVGIIISLISINESGGWSFLGVIAGLPLLLIFLLADVIAKAIITKTAVLWIVEVAAIVLTLVIYRTYMFG